MINKKTVFEQIKRYFFICLGFGIFTFGWSAFLIPNQLMGGGVSGVASLIFFATTIPLAISTLVINFILVAISIKILGRKFGITTIIYTLILSLLFGIMQPLFPQPLVDDKFLCALIGAMLSGTGIAIALNNGGNTGGTDIIILMISKYRNISYGRLSMMMNVVIIGCSYLIVQSVECLVYSYVSMIASAYTTDFVIEGYRQTYQIMVFSSKSHELAQRINQDLNRGATLLKGYGSYSKEETDILLVIAHREDRANIIRIIKEVDDAAFMSISKTNGVFGKNFDTLRM